MPRILNIYVQISFVITTETFCSGYRIDENQNNSVQSLRGITFRSSFDLCISQISQHVSVVRNENILVCMRCMSCRGKGLSTWSQL